MTEKRYRVMNHDDYELDYIADSQHGFEKVDLYDCCDLLNENEQLKKELKRCRDWLNSDKNDYQLTLAFIKSKGYSLKDVLEYEKELKE